MFVSCDVDVIFVLCAISCYFMLLYVILCYFLVLSMIFFDILCVVFLPFYCLFMIFYDMLCYVFLFNSKVRQQNRDKSRAEFTPPGGDVFFSGGGGGMLSCDFVDTLWFLYGHVYGYLVLFSCYFMWFYVCFVRC